MAEDLKTTVAEPESNSDENKRESYPIKTFKAIEPFVGNIYKKYGDSEVISNEKIADANNLSVNSIKQIVSTSNQYQCLKKIHGKGYKITEAFTKIFHPENDEEKIQTIIECIKNVPFYIPLINDYNEKVVPSIEGLQNRFIRDNKMKPHLAKAAAEIFIQNLKDFNLVNTRGVLIFKSEQKPITQNNISPAELNGINIAPSTGMQTKNTKDINDNLVEIPIRLKDSRMAYLSFPKDFTDDDLKKIFKVAKAYIEAYGDDIDLSDKKGAT